jgi:diguanylate cyclase (GGDEF)-like protein
MSVSARIAPRATVAILTALGVALGAVVAAWAGAPGAGAYDVAWTSAAIAATLGAFVARRRACPAQRGLWTWWWLASLSWLLGQVAWNVYGIVGFPPSPNLADIGWWVCAVCIMASMLSLPSGPTTMRLVALLESTTLIVAAVAFCISELWGTMEHSHLALGPKISALLYPALYASTTIVIVQAALSGPLREIRSRGVWTALAGLLAQSLAFTVWSSQLLSSTYQPGSSLLDLTWVVGLAAVAVGGLLADRSPAKPAAPAEGRGVGVLLPSTVFAMLLIALLFARLTGQQAEARTVLHLGVFFAAIALVARSNILARRLGVLLARERASAADLAEREAELARLNAQLLEASRRDPLTGIGNRRALTDDLPMYEMFLGEAAESLAVALCDVDHFKAYNDQMGHLAGDQALRMIANTARGALRAGDSAYRYGGEELLLVLRGVDTQEALAIADRVRAAVERAALPHPTGEAGILTVSVGVAAGREPLEALLERADSALYEAKRLGRNRAISARRDAEADGHGGHHARQAQRGDPGAPIPRHLRAMLSVSRAAAANAGVMPVVRALAEVIQSELSFQVVAVNLMEEDREHFRVVQVLGNREARELLQDRVTPRSEWDALFAQGVERHGACWLEAGSYEEPGHTWTAPEVPSLQVNAWQPQDMLLLPLRDALGEIFGVVSVDQPALGQRPSDEEIGVLMSVVDHAGLVASHLELPSAELREQPAELRLAAVMLLAETLDLRDPSTALHSRTVGRLARGTAVALGLEESRVERIHAAGVLHDLGKLGIPDHILQKPGGLSESEWREIRRHPDLGARILEHAGMRDIAHWVRCHHERLDGHGYPQGMPGEAIPLEARILAVADAYEAMIADRPYRAGMPPCEATEELRRCSGTQFDPEIVDAFMRALDRTPVVVES